MSDDIARTIDALVHLHGKQLIDSETFTDLVVEAATSGQQPAPVPYERHRYPKRENWEYNGIHLPSGAPTQCLLFLAEHAGTAFGSAQVRKGLGLPGDRATRSTIGSSLTVLKQRGLVHHESPSWWISDLGMEVAAAYQQSH